MSALVRGASKATAQDMESWASPNDDSAARPDAVPSEPMVLGLGPTYVAKGEIVRRKFRTAKGDGTTDESILEELVATEVPIAMALQDAEAALVSLLHKTITNPQLAVAVAKLLKDTVVVSSAVRRRIENSLGAVANLRAQRAFLERQRR